MSTIGKPSQDQLFANLIVEDSLLVKKNLTVCRNIESSSIVAETVTATDLFLGPGGSIIDEVCATFPQGICVENIFGLSPINTNDLFVIGAGLQIPSGAVTGYVLGALDANGTAGWIPDPGLGMVNSASPLTGDGTLLDAVRFANGAVVGNILQWNGAAWVEIPLPPSTVTTAAPLTGDGSGGNPVTFASGAVLGNLLQWTGGAWVETGGGGVPNDFLQWNGATWVPATPPLSPFLETLNDVNVGYNTAVTGSTAVNLILGTMAADPTTASRTFVTGSSHDFTNLAFPPGSTPTDNFVVGGTGSDLQSSVFFSITNSGVLGGSGNNLNATTNCVTAGCLTSPQTESNQSVCLGCQTSNTFWATNCANLATLNTACSGLTANGLTQQCATVACESSEVRVIGGGFFGLINDSMVCAGNGLTIQMLNGNQLDRCFIAGGQTNTINESTGTTQNCAIIGGNGNTISSASNSVILGGSGHMNTGSNSVLLGTSAVCSNSNCFLFSDGSGGLASSANNTFLALASGGTTFFSSLGLGTGVTLGPGLSAWAAVCDRNAKENLVELKYEDVLTKLDSIPIYQFNYIDDEAQKKNMGPMAQDWHGQFTDTGKDPLKIDTMDLDGVALASIKALKAQISSQQTLIEQLSARLDALENA
jgi:hypothetical protein